MFKRHDIPCKPCLPRAPNTTNYIIPGLAGVGIPFNVLEIIKAWVSDIERTLPIAFSVNHIASKTVSIKSKFENKAQSNILVSITTLKLVCTNAADRVVVVRSSQYEMLAIADNKLFARLSPFNGLAGINISWILTFGL